MAYKIDKIRQSWAQASRGQNVAAGTSTENRPHETAMRNTPGAQLERRLRLSRQQSGVSKSTMAKKSQNAAVEGQRETQDAMGS